MELTREGWDSLVQNPFLAFYQRWPWAAHTTPLLNIWKPLEIDIAVDSFITFFSGMFSGLWHFIPDPKSCRCMGVWWPNWHSWVVDVRDSVRVNKLHIWPVGRR